MSENEQDELRAEEILSEAEVNEVETIAALPLDEQAKQILGANDRGNYTIPAENLYPHQWLWDSCFVAIGLRHIDVDRAQTELLNLVKGQWSNGMLPNMIFSNEPEYRRDREFWRSWISPYSPDGIATSGITQPPMLAEAVWQVGQKLTLAECVPAPALIVLSTVRP